MCYCTSASGVLAPGFMRCLRSVMRPHDSVRFRTNPQALLRKVRQSGRLHQDLLAGAETRIQQAACLQRIECCAIRGEMLRLAAHRGLPAQAEPGQVLEDSRSEEHTSELQSL